MTPETVYEEIGEAVRVYVESHGGPPGLLDFDWSEPVRFEEVGLDSLATMMLLSLIERQVGLSIPDRRLSEIETTADLVELVVELDAKEDDDA